MARRQNIVGQSSDFEVYPGAVREPVKLICEIDLLSRRDEIGRMTVK